VRHSATRPGSVYKYFSSGEEILERIAADAFADWGTQVREAVARAADPGGRIYAYVQATLALADSGAHRIAVFAGGLPRQASRASVSPGHTTT
jgi:AcrR family transcriptional regulator